MALDMLLALEHLILLLKICWLLRKWILRFCRLLDRSLVIALTSLFYRWWILISMCISCLGYHVRGSPVGLIAFHAIAWCVALLHWDVSVYITSILLENMTVGAAWRRVRCCVCLWHLAIHYISNIMHHWVNILLGHIIRVRSLKLRIRVIGWALHRLRHLNLILAHQLLLIVTVYQIWPFLHVLALD